MKRIDGWDELCERPSSKVELYAPLIALGLALLIAWL
jgi:hypothetical protein